MAKQTFTTGQVLLASQLTSLQQTAMLGGAASAKTASYTLVAADAGTAISMTSTSATTITVNTGLFAAGDTVQITNLGSGVCTITAGTATVNTSASLALAQYESGTLDFTSSSAAIFIKGAGAAASSGGMTLITTTTFDNSVSTYTYSSLGSYKHLLITIHNLTRNNASSIDNVLIRFNSDTGSNYRAQGYGLNNGTFGDINSGGGTSNYLFYRNLAPSGATGTDKGNGSAWIYDYSGSGIKQHIGWSRANIPASAAYAYTVNGVWNDTNAITSVTVFTESTNNFNTGTLRLYGVS